MRSIRCSAASAFTACATIAAIVGLSGCTHVTPHFTTMGYDAQSMEVVGPATVSATHYYVFGFGPAGGEDALAVAAVQAAAKSVNADAIINITADHSTYVHLFGLYIRKRVTVTGTAVRFRK